MTCCSRPKPNGCVLCLTGDSTGAEYGERSSCGDSLNAGAAPAREDVADASSDRLPVSPRSDGPAECALTRPSETLQIIHSGCASFPCLPTWSLGLTAAQLAHAMKL